MCRWAQSPHAVALPICDVIETSTAALRVCIVKALEALVYSDVRVRDLRKATSAKITLGKAIMDFEFSDEQELLREQARGFLADNCPPMAVRKVLDSDAQYDAEL